MNIQPIARGQSYLSKEMPTLLCDQAKTLEVRCLDMEFTKISLIIHHFTFLLRDLYFLPQIKQKSFQTLEYLSNYHCGSPGSEIFPLPTSISNSIFFPPQHLYL